MLKFTLRILFVLFAAAALGGWADRRGFLNSFWDTTMPVTTFQAAPDEAPGEQP